jgi:[ribosomal protein S5]-alanine N-acetyltransferase
MTARVILPVRDTLIVTPRLTLEPAKRTDFLHWAALREASRAHLERWEPSWPHDAHSKADWTRRLSAWQATWRAGTAYVFLIRRQGDRTLVGGLSLTNVRPWPAKSASLGYWLGAVHEGNGYMQEAVVSLCDWAMSDLGLHRIEAATLPGNARSRRVLETAGFAEEGLARAYLEINGTWRDHVLFGLVRPDGRD